jgi:hypothetical protein
MALTDKLSAIGTAIREKTGGSELLTLDAMPGAIRGISGGGGGEVEPIELTGSQSNACGGAIATNYIKLFGNTITTKNITDTNNMFASSTLEKIPFGINYSNGSPRNMSMMYSKCSNLTELPVMNNVYPEQMNGLFEYCQRLRYLPENFGADWNWDRIHSYNYSKINGVFSSCYSLRKIPSSFLSDLWNNATTSSYIVYYSAFYSCFCLDEIIGLPIHPVGISSNAFSSDSFNLATRVKDITFVMDNNMPKTANWTKQVIDLKTVGHYDSYTGNNKFFINYNSGITADKEVFDDATYQALKDDPDWFTCNVSYSRYNHDSAVNTINSLPDTSAYIAEKGGTNTIKLKGAAGALTDGGAINTLTEEEIAVAAAKGWTITLV